MEEKATCVQSNRDKFYAVLLKDEIKNNSYIISKEKYSALIQDVKRIKSSKKKCPRDYRIIHRYDVLTFQGSEKLIKPLTDLNEDVKFYVELDEIFDIIYSTHLSTGHGGRDRMLNELNRYYNNITQSQIKIFLDLCESCREKRKSDRKGVLKPMIFSHFNSRGHIDLIDFQSQADGDFKFLLVYQDHFTKFVVLKPLTSKQTHEVACNVLDIFLLIGAPCIIQSDDGREFCNQILENLTTMWPELKIVHGNARDSQHQGSLERVHHDIENMLITWMKDNNTTKWSEGARFVQFMKNRAFHSDIERTPYEAMFGCSPKVGLTSSTIPQNILKDINSEEDLQKLAEEQSSKEHKYNSSKLNVKTEKNDSLELNNLQSLLPRQEHITSESEKESDDLQADLEPVLKKQKCIISEFKIEIEEDSL